MGISFQLAIRRMHTVAMTGLCPNPEMEMPRKEARAFQEASVTAKRVQLVLLSWTGQG